MAPGLSFRHNASSNIFVKLKFLATNGLPTAVKLVNSIFRTNPVYESHDFHKKIALYSNSCVSCTEVSEKLNHWLTKMNLKYI
jgi:hypothetical protein